MSEATERPASIRPLSVDCVAKGSLECLMQLLGVNTTKGCSLFPRLLFSAWFIQLVCVFSILSLNFNMCVSVDVCSP